MKRIIRYILPVIAALCAVGLASCTKNRPDDGEPDGDGPEDRMLLVLHIMPVDGESVTTHAEVREMIGSLRIILLSDGIIECNQRIAFNGPGPFTASQFNYDFTWSTFAGKKSFYIIANEESVTNGLQFQRPDGDAGVLPEVPVSLTALLNSYKAVGKEGLGNAEAENSCAELERVLKSLCFKPDYTAEGGDLYLPYVSYYSAEDVEALNIKKGDFLGEEAPFTLYLVPVATKFTFNFTNYRPNNVEIKNITVSSANSANFLMARVGEGDYTKLYGTSDDRSTWLPYYWIDWLARVSEASHQNEDFDNNQNFNTKYGWISLYDIPAGDTPKPQTLITAETFRTVDKAVKTGAEGEDEDGTPGTLTLGSYYLPESRNIDTETGRLAYYLTLGLHDVTQTEDDDPKFENQPIQNLNALFRNTRVIINVVMRQGDVRVYAEIAKWSEKTANGWVVEGPEP